MASLVTADDFVPVLYGNEICPASPIYDDSNGAQLRAGEVPEELGVKVLMRKPQITLNPVPIF